MDQAKTIKKIAMEWRRVMRDQVRGWDVWRIEYAVTLRGKQAMGHWDQCWLWAGLHGFGAHIRTKKEAHTRHAHALKALAMLACQQAWGKWEDLWRTAQKQACGYEAAGQYMLTGTLRSGWSLLVVTLGERKARLETQKAMIKRWTMPQYTAGLLALRTFAEWKMSQHRLVARAQLFYLLDSRIRYFRAWRDASQDGEARDREASARDEILSVILSKRSLKRWRRGGSDLGKSGEAMTTTSVWYTKRMQYKVLATWRAVIGQDIYVSESIRDGLLHCVMNALSVVLHRWRDQIATKQYQLKLMKQITVQYWMTGMENAFWDL